MGTVCGRILILLGIIACSITSEVFAIDRCISFVPDVRQQFTLRFGWGAPWAYGLGQLQQESNCRNVTAFDGGMGPAQFMPKTATWINSLMKENLDPRNSKDACRMQAYYMWRIHKVENWTGKLWSSFQIYNGGKSALYKEFQRAGTADWTKMKAVCTRKKIEMKWGVLDFCDVNYSYSCKVFAYGKGYPTGFGSIVFW